MKPNLRKHLVAILAGLLIAIPQAAASARNVDCDNGDSLANALTSGLGSAATLEINLIGTCHGDFTINRDRVRVLGDHNASIVGSIRVFGSDNVAFRDLTITGPGDGLLIFNSRVRLIDVRVTANEGTGISLDESGALQMTRGEVNANAEFGVQARGSHAKFFDTQIVGNSAIGIRATGGSSLHIEGGAVSNSGIHGIEMMFNSALFLWHTELSNNGAVEGYGAMLTMGSSGELHFATIKENSGEGVEAIGNSAVEINGGVIHSNLHHGVSLGLGSVADLVGGVQIFGNGADGVFLDAASGLWVRDNSSIPPNGSGWSVGCNGDESSVAVFDPAFVPAIGCTDPDF